MFYGYATVAHKCYREVFGLAFEDFKPGQVFRHRPGITVSQQDNKDESMETLNNAMLHYDAHYAAATEWKHPLGVSTLTLQRVLGSTWKTFYNKARIRRFDKIAMTRPVFDGDTLYARSSIQSVHDTPGDTVHGEVRVLTEALNQRHETVATIDYTMLIYRRAQSPQARHEAGLLEPVDHPKFLAYHVNAANEMTEQAGLFFEDFEVGERYQHRPGKTFLEAENWMHATRSLDWHPRYVDWEHIKRFEQGKQIVNDYYLLGAATALTTRTFDRVVANLGWINTEFVEPVYVGDTLYAESEILGTRESKSRPDQGIITAKTVVVNQRDQIAVQFERNFLVYRRGLGPYEKAGY
jgi:itaconyl-CoA hydratase